MLTGSRLFMLYLVIDSPLDQEHIDVMLPTFQCGRWLHL